MLWKLKGDCMSEELLNSSWSLMVSFQGEGRGGGGYRQTGGDTSQNALGSLYIKRGREGKGQGALPRIRF